MHNKPHNIIISVMCQPSMVDKFLKNKLGENCYQRILYGLLLVVLISFFISLFRQFVVQRRIDRELSNRQEELLILERKNQELKAKLQETKDPLFLENQVRKMANLPPIEASLPPVEEAPELKLKEEKFRPKYKQWLELFLY